MRSTNGAIPGYVPTPAPFDAADIGRWAESELARIGSVLAAIASGRIEPATAEPVRPRDGMTRLADGTSWNPGSGQGAYVFYAGSWHKMG